MSFSPRITHLRQVGITRVADKLPQASILDSKAGGFVADRAADFGVGVANYVVTPQENNLTPKDALKEGFKSAASGVAGAASTGISDTVRPATPNSAGE